MPYVYSALVVGAVLLLIKVIFALNERAKTALNADDLIHAAKWFLEQYVAPSALFLVFRRRDRAFAVRIVGEVVVLRQVNDEKGVNFQMEFLECSGIRDECRQIESAWSAIGVETKAEERGDGGIRKWCEIPDAGTALAALAAFMNASHLFDHCRKVKVRATGVDRPLRRREKSRAV